MQTGKFNERITIEQLTVIKGTSGGMQKTWAPFATNIAASRRDFGGNEKPASSAAGGEVALARTEFTVHWMPGVEATMRVLHDGALHNIRHVNNFAGRRQSLILTCDTGVNNG